MMRNFIFLALCAVCMGLVGCSKYDLQEQAEQAEQLYEKKFTFTVKGDFVNPAFSGEDNLYDVGTDAPQLAKSRANSYMTADGTEMTDLWVVDCVNDDDDDNDNFVIKQMVHQTKEDADWGEPSMALTLGTHHVLFLASRGTAPVYSEGVVTWTKPSDTFYLDYEVTVVKTSNGNRAVTLDRVATRMSLVIEDAIPNGTTTISLKPTTWYAGWNLLTGAPVAADGYVARYDLPQTWWGGTKSTLNMWGVSGAAEWTTDVTITSKAGEVVNASAVIEGAPFKANRATRYSGCLYSNNEENSVSLNATWLSEYEGVY